MYNCTTEVRHIALLTTSGVMSLVHALLCSSISLAEGIMTPPLRPEVCEKSGKPLPVYRWPQLTGKKIVVLREWHRYMRNMDMIESLSVSAFSKRSNAIHN